MGCELANLNHRGTNVGKNFPIKHEAFNIIFLGVDSNPTKLSMRHVCLSLMQLGVHLILLPFLCRKVKQSFEHFNH